MLYKQLENFSLTPSLISKIKSLDVEDLKIATRYGRFDYIKSLRNYHGLSWKTILKDWAFSYGFMFSEAATIDSLMLPLAIENDIIDQLADRFTQSVIDDCVIRLQAVYGNRCIPPHIDITRTASLIYPISNHDESQTVFFDIDRPIDKQEQFFNPSDIVKNTAIVIDHHPVLFNTKKIHSIYLPTPISKSNPRISISVKWRSFTVEKILSESNK